MFFGMLRVKDEERWITRSLTPLLEICEEVFVLDDHSVDRTREIVKDAGCTLIESPYDTLEESRDKTYLLSKIEEYVPSMLGPDSPHWVICVDGDEEICECDLGKFSQSARPGVVSYSFQILTLYDSPDQIRVDGPYAKMLRPSMFRLIKPGMKFMSHARHGGGFHCSNVPADIGFGVTIHQPAVRVKHYGYMEKRDRERKYKFYVENDPGHEGWYKKECLGRPVLAELPEGL